MTSRATRTPTGQSRLRAVLLFPLTRLVLALVIIAVAFIARDVVANGLLRLPGDAVAARGIVTVLVVWLAYAQCPVLVSSVEAWWPFR